MGENDNRSIEQLKIWVWLKDSDLILHTHTSVRLKIKHPDRLFFCFKWWIFIHSENSWFFFCFRIENPLYKQWWWNMCFEYHAMHIDLSNSIICVPANATPGTQTRKLIFILYRISYGFLHYWIVFFLMDGWVLTSYCWVEVAIRVYLPMKWKFWFFFSYQNQNLW